MLFRSIIETYAKKFTKVVAESLPITESISNRPQSNQSDILPISESVIHGEQPKVAEAVAIAETRTFVFTKIISEGLSITENVLYPIATQSGLGNAALGTIALGN